VQSSWSNTTDDEEDYKYFFHTLTTSERLAHLGAKHCATGQPVATAFYRHLLALVDSDGDGKVSPGEFREPRGPTDLAEWPLEKRCVPRQASGFLPRVEQHAAAGVEAPEADQEAFLKSASTNLQP